MNYKSLKNKNKKNKKNKFLSRKKNNKTKKYFKSKNKKNKFLSRKKNKKTKKFGSGPLSPTQERQLKIKTKIEEIKKNYAFTKNNVKNSSSEFSSNSIPNQGFMESGYNFDDDDSSQLDSQSPDGTEYLEDPSARPPLSHIPPNLTTQNDEQNLSNNAAAPIESTYDPNREISQQRGLSFFPVVKDEDDEDFKMVPRARPKFKLKPPAKPKPKRNK